MFKPVDPKPNFPEMEKKILDFWYKQGIVDKYLHKNDRSNKRFSFLDGPITANNAMGVHHAWGRTYKDLWQRFYNMMGYRQRFQNGFDCQGLWIEVEVEKELGIRNKRDIENLVPGDKKKSIAKFVQLCKDRVMKFSKIQTEQTKRLGNFMVWENSYYTMSDENNYMIWHFLKTCHEKGWIYKGRDSVPWCPRCETAISQHEMLTEDYKEIVHESIYFRLPLEGKKGEYLLLWTTTPWTIPANIAVAIDETFDYSLVEGKNGKKYWLARDLVEPTFGKDYKKTVKTVKGKELVGLKYKGPFDELDVVKKTKEENREKFHIVIPTDQNILPIVLTEGTGMVHTAVSAGVEDFKLGKKLGLPMIPVIADNADYLPTMGFLAGKNAKKNPRLILNFVEEKGFAFKIHNYKHRYPACWRCKEELVWKVADEWYIAMDRKSKMENGKLKVENKTLREKMINVAKKINWKPAFGLERELDWLNNMHDWLISKKNRYWGLALPIYECKKCGNFEVIGGKEELKKRAVSGWEKFEGNSPHKPYVDEVKIRCSQCNSPVSRIDDVGNVWLDAGIVPFSTYVDQKSGKLSYVTDKNYWKEWFPADFITESFPGQFKNWFYSMIAMSTVLEYKNPYNTVLGYASMLGEDGRPMHKSWGNAIDFNTGAEKIGVDVMRWMFATHDPEQNLLFGYRKADETRRKFHLLLWNIYNFFVTYA
ncbi:class I tRNA ligase family protein, partial [Candidatus Gottesmanbacteria bacterium]|nr:class I tRNA ligase family protein [Candidatus Gottesmanbacteria bacterium]